MRVTFVPIGWEDYRDRQLINDITRDDPFSVSGSLAWLLSGEAMESAVTPGRSRGILDDKQRGEASQVTEPAEHERYEQPREKSVEEILAAARPLPSSDEMVIDDLTDEEERLFFEAIRAA